MQKIARYERTQAQLKNQTIEMLLQDRKDLNNFRQVMEKVSENEVALLESYESSIDKEIEIQENLNIFFTSEKNKNLLRRNYELSKEKLMISSKQIIFFKKLADDTIHKRANTELLEQVNIGNALENSMMSYADSLKSTRIFIH